MNAAQTFVGATLMDSSAALRRWMIDKLIVDAPSREDLAHDDWRRRPARVRRVDHAVGACANTNIPTIMIGETVAATILANA